MPGYNQAKVFKEIDIFHRVQGEENTIQLFDYFKQLDCFYLIFERASGAEDAEQDKDKEQSKSKSESEDESEFEDDHMPYWGSKMSRKTQKDPKKD